MKRLYGNGFLSKRKKIRHRLFSRDGNKCFYCGRSMKNTPDATIDHIKPVGEYGRNNDLSNLRLIHNDCRVQRDWAIQKGILYDE